jgi:hypothetical protein
MTEEDLTGWSGSFPLDENESESYDHSTPE